MNDTQDTNSLYVLLESLKKQQAINPAYDWEKVHKRIKADRNKNLFLRFVKTAAALLLPLFLLWQYVLSPSIGQQHFVTVASSQYGISKVLLSDGSEVWLNASSRLTYPQEFKKNNRSVHLDGEAYFKVKANKKKPFNVLVNNKMTVSAYGTEFNVDGYENSENYTVVLTDGSVEVLLPSTKKSVRLQPGQQAFIAPATNEIQVDVADVYLKTAWKDGKMIFYRERFSDIAARLSKRFDVVFQFSDETIKQQQYTGTFTTESVIEILDLLKQSAPIDYAVTYSDEGGRLGAKKRIITIQAR